MASICQLTSSSPSMTGMVGLDGFLTSFQSGKLSGLQRALLSALQSGAFMTAEEHSRYDPEKFTMCTQCECEDSRAHWLQCPRYEHLRGSIVGWSPDRGLLPPCFVNHLLVPRQKLAVEWRAAPWNLDNSTKNVCLVTPPKGLNHVFVDGSCTRPDLDPLKLASWAVLNATTGLPIAAAPHHGLAQCIDRAELSAILVAARWCVHFEAETCVWAFGLTLCRQWNRPTSSCELTRAHWNCEL